MAKSTPLVSVILAAGRGTRMRSAVRPKVCHPLRGRAVIARAISLYSKMEIESHIIVVGEGAEHVMREAASISDCVLCCLQPDPLGTGNAARIAVRALAATGYSGDVLIVAGDKILTAAALEKLLDRFYSSRADLAFLVAGEEDFPSAGRVCYDQQGVPCAIFEKADLALAQLVRQLGAEADPDRLAPELVRALALRLFGRESAARKGLGRVWDQIESGRAVSLSLFPQPRIAHPEATGLRSANLSVYAGRMAPLIRALEGLTRDNAQNEEYLTDIVASLARDGARLTAVPVDSPRQVQAFNTPEELAQIEAQWEDE